MSVIRDGDIDKIVWVSCRGKRDCPGKQAKIVMKMRLPQGGISIRYRCQTCNKVFYVTI